MSKKIVLRFTVKELSGLIQDEKSRVILQRCIRKIPLQPYCLNDLRNSIHEELDANLAKFDHELKGMLLSYKNVKIVKNVANMLHDDSRLYVTIQADFYLFMPEVGRILCGIVNKKSADHIGCLVHKAFNVSIPRPRCELDGDWKGFSVEIGQEVTFRVESLDLTGSLPYMVGHLLDLGSVSSSDCLKFSEGNVSDSLFNGQNIGKSNEFQEPLDIVEDNNSVVNRKEKKKHKKDKKNAGLEGISELSFTEDRSSNSILSKGTKKMKKRKDAEHHKTLKQEEQVYSRDGEGQSVNGQDSYVENEKEYEEQLTKDEKHSDHSLHVATIDSISSGVTGKKKKRKYSEVFQDKLDYGEPYSKSQDESCTSCKPKKRRKKQILGMAYMYEDSHGINATPEGTEYNIENSETGKLVKEQLCKEAEFVEETEYVQHSTDTLEELTKSKKKKKKEKLLREMSNVELENHSIDTSQEVTEDKKNKKKRKRNKSEGTGDETLFGVTDEPTYSVSHTTTSYNKHLTNRQDPDNRTEEVENETSLDREYCKKLNKKNKSQGIYDITTSTPVEYRHLKVSKISCNLLNKSDMKQLQLSPVETKGLRHEGETENGAQSLKVKSLKKQNMPYLRTENSCSTPLSSLQRRENKFETDNQAENSSPTKAYIACTRPVQGNSADVNDSQDDSGDSDNRHTSVYTHSGKIKAELSRISENVPEMEKHKVQHNVNTEEENSSPNRGSLEKSSKQNENKYSQTLRNTDRACSSDSGLSFSVASGDRESGSSVISEKRREVSYFDTRHNIEDSLKDEQPIKISKTPKRKRTSSPDGSLGLHSAKKNKKKKERSIPSSSQQSKVDLSEYANLSETDRMKVIAVVMKMLGGGNGEESNVKQEHSTHREKKQSMLSTDEHPSSSSKNVEKRKRKSKDNRTKNHTMQKLDTADSCRKDVSMWTTNLVSSPLSNRASVTGTTVKNQSNLRSEEEQSPVRLQTKASQKTPKKKKSSNPENSKIKYSSKEEIKIKVEKKSPKKNETTLSSNIVGLKSPEEETPAELAERLLQQFLKQESEKRRSIC